MTGLTLTANGGTTGGIESAGIFEPGPVLKIGYRRRLIQALNVKFRRGEISKEDYWKIRRASYNREFINGFVLEIEHAAKVAGDFIDDVQAWFKVLLDWLIENWDVVLKVLLTLLMLVI